MYEFVPYCPSPSYYVFTRCFQTTSIRHAAMALGALHKAQLIESNPLIHNRSLSARKHHMRALGHYANAIRTMNEELASQEMDLQSVLLSCLLAFGFEAYHGNSALAEKQILCGLSFISAWQSSHAAGKQRVLGFWVPAPPDVGNDLCQFFGRLELQLGLQGKVDMFGQNVPERDGQYALAHMPVCFDDLVKAQGFLHLLMKRLQFFLQSARAVNTPPKSDLIPAELELSAEEAANKKSELETMQAVQVGDFKRWKQSFDTMLLQEWTRDESHTLMITIVKLHYFTNLLVLNTLLLDSMVYDTMTAEFEEIIDLAARLITIINSRTRTSKFNFDLGSVLPLYLVALRCRVRETRDRAIGLLLDHPRREGIWDSVFAGRFTRWIADQEDRERDANDLVPAWARVRCVYSDFDLQSRCAAVRCLQQERRGGGFEDMVRKATIAW